MRLLLQILILSSQLFFSCFGQKTMTSSSRQGSLQRKALLIGNFNYPWDRLKNPGRDVDSMKVVLERLNFKVFAYKNLTYSESAKIIEAFSRGLSKEETELVFFYFSGHGLALGDHNYLLPTDTRLNCIEELKSYEAMALPNIVKKMLAREIKHNYFFLDACRNLNDLTNCDGSRATNLGGLVKPQETHTGAVLSFATTAGKTADDDTYDKFNSLFTAELIKYLPTPNVNIRRVLDMVKNGVFMRSGREQNPQTWTDILSDYVLLPTHTRDTPVPPMTSEKSISVIAYKLNSTEPDYDLARKAIAALKLKYPDHNIERAGGKSLGAGIKCAIKMKTITGKNPVTISGRTYNLIKAETKITLIFKEGDDVTDEVELIDVGTDHQEAVAIQNSVDAALKKLKDIDINLVKR